MDNEIQDQADFAQNISIAISRRKAFEMAAKLGLGSAAFAGGLGTGMAANPPEAGGGLPKKNYKFVYVCHLTSSQFLRLWKDFHKKNYEQSGIRQSSLGLERKNSRVYYAAVG